MIQARQSLPVPQGEQLGVAWSRDGARIAALNRSHSISLWDPLNGTLRRFLKNVGYGPSAGLAFSPDSSRIACVLEDGRVQIWDCESGEPVPVQSETRFSPRPLAWSPQSGSIALFRGGNIELWESYSGAPARQIAATQNVRSLSWSPGGDCLASAGEAGVKIWNRDLLPRKNHILSSEGQQSITSVVWSRDSSELFAAQSGGSIQVWDTNTCTISAIIEAHRADVVDMAVSSDNKWLASKSLDGMLCCTQIEDKSVVVREREAALSCDFPVLQFHPLLPVLATADPERNVIALRYFPVSDRASAPVSVFFSYSHDDIREHRRLKEFLSPLERNNRIVSWDDERLRAGGAWQPEIMQQLDRAQVIVVLLSASFLSSEFCNREMSRAMDRHAKGDATVIPVVLSPGLLDEFPIGRLQRIPERDKRAVPISLWTNKDEAFAEVARAIREVIDARFPPSSQVVQQR